VAPEPEPEAEPEKDAEPEDLEFAPDVAVPDCEPGLPAPSEEPQAARNAKQVNARLRE
jgi:hypothetical protein